VNERSDHQIWGAGMIDKSVGKTIDELVSRPAGILCNVRQESLVKEEVVKHWH